MEKLKKAVHQKSLMRIRKIDLILEQTFFCALQPSLRGSYVKNCNELLNEEKKITGVLFHKKFAPTEPPFIATDDLKAHSGRAG